MRKYVINYKYEAYEKGHISHSTLIGCDAAYGLKELKGTLKFINHDDIDCIDILSGDGENAIYFGKRKF